MHPKIGLTFGHALRSILRHDPDIILVGEIRDLETAENAIQASLTGHLVFSTLHTNDAAGAYTRLVDMGVEPFLVSSTVEAVMAQRLVRDFVPALQRAVPSQGRRAAAPIFPATASAGCGRCTGRWVAASACRWDTAAASGCSSCCRAPTKIRQLAHDRASSWTIQHAAVRQGMLTLRHDGWRKVLDGRTTIDEVLRVTKARISRNRAAEPVVEPITEP